MPLRLCLLKRAATGSKKIPEDFLKSAPAGINDNGWPVQDHRPPVMLSQFSLHKNKLHQNHIECGSAENTEERILFPQMQHHNGKNRNGLRQSMGPG